MEQQVRVQKILDDGTAQVVLSRQNACSGDCHKCSGCGAVGQTLTVVAQNPIGACVGDGVIIRSKTAPVMKGALVLYILPLLLFFLGYALGAALHWNGVLAGGLGFVLGVVAIAGVVVYDRRVSAKENNVYTIVGYWETNAERKGDN